MAVVFGVRGTSKDARYSNGGKDGIDHNSEWTVTTDAGAISGSALVPGSNNNRKGIVWPGRLNTPNGRAISIMTRIKPNYSGAPSASRPLLVQVYAGGNRLGRIEIIHTITTGAVGIIVSNNAGSTSINSSFGNWTTNTSGTWYDLVFTWDGTTTANAMKFYIDGTLLGSLTASAALSSSMTNKWWSEISLGDTVAGNVWNTTSVDEVVIWDSVIDPTSVTLDSGSGSLNGASRTSPVTVSSLDGANWTSLAADKIKTGESQTQAGVSVTGTYDGSDRWTDPGESNVKTGTAYKANSTSNNKTGTYTGSDRWTDPGIANVRSGTAYKADSTSNNRTGTAAIPTAANVRSGTATDATTGTLAVPSAANVLNGVSVDAGTGTYVGPATTDVKTGVTYGAASALTGSYDGSDRHTDPGEANVKTGTAYKSNSLTNNKTGTYTGSDRWTDPGIANVRSGTAYKADSTSNNRTGTAAIPTASNVKIGVSTDATTGTYDGSDRWTDIPESKVEDGYQYKSNSLTDNKTGTLVTGSTDYPDVADVREGVEYSDGDLIGTLDLASADELIYGATQDNGAIVGTAITYPTDFRSGLDSIFRFIGEPSLTDNEFESLTVDANSPSADIYEALDAILVTRGATEHTHEQLEYYFLAKNVDLSEAEEAEEPTSKILVGSVLEDAVASDANESNVYIGGDLS